MFLIQVWIWFSWQEFPIEWNRQRWRRGAMFGSELKDEEWEKRFVWAPFARSIQHEPEDAHCVAKRVYKNLCERKNFGGGSTQIGSSFYRNIGPSIWLLLFGGQSITFLFIFKTDRWEVLFIRFTEHSWLASFGFLGCVCLSVCFDFIFLGCVRILSAVMAFIS